MNYKQWHTTYTLWQTLQNDHNQHRNKSIAMCGNHIQRVNLIEQVTDFKYLGYRISEYKSDLEDILQTYNKINGAIR